MTKHTNQSNSRQPNQKELDQLARYAQGLGRFLPSGDHDLVLQEAIEYAAIAVFDAYPLLGSDAYPDGLGKVMFVAWPYGPEYYTVYYWKDGHLQRLNQDSETVEAHY
jgi:hypothetical protein